MRRAKKSYGLEWGNLRIPYVALWSSESAGYVAVDQNAASEFAIFCNGRQGDGKPVFGKMEYSRQRFCASRGLCQVCREKPDRYFWMSVIPSWMQERGRNYPLVVEPLVCAGCAIYSLENCPGVQKGFTDEHFLACEVFRWRTVPVLIEAQRESDYPDLDEALRKHGGPAVGYVKLQLLDYKKFTLEEFRETLHCNVSTKAVIGSVA